MLKDSAKRALDTAVGELKSDGYTVLVIMLEKSRLQGTDAEAVDAMEVLCSETNNPLIIAELAKAALQGLSQGDGLKGSHVN